MKLPPKGIAKEILLQKLTAYDAMDVPWHDGRTWAYVYDPGREAEEIGKQAYMQFLTANGLDFTVYRSTLRFENELVAMGAAHLGGDDRVVGNFTSGGTESIILAMKSARDYARARRPRVGQPEIVLPITAHAAFHKAAHYLGLKVVLADVDHATFRADPEALRRAITPNTIALVGSAPSYPHGVVDPIGALGEIALEHDLWLHCDACVGGFLLPYFRRLGTQVPDFDFGVPGVTSISMDLHKYGYTPKGASLVLYRDKDFRRYQLFTCANWTGYTVVNTSLQSSKSGGPVAAAWAVVNFIGDEGYLELARLSYEGTKRLVAGIESIPGLRLMARPDLSMFSFTSDTMSVFHIVDEMRERRWYIQPQFAFGPSKENIHLSVGASNVQWVEAFLADLRACAEKAATMEWGQYAAAVRDSFASLDPSGFTAETFAQMLAFAGIQGGGLMPDRWAPINEMLNALPVKLRELVLTEYLNEVFQPR